jgi:hypothetical protein
MAGHKAERRPETSPDSSNPMQRKNSPQPVLGPYRFVCYAEGQCWVSKDKESCVIAALTPRVRTLVICDGIRASNREDNVFHLRGARYHLVADSFPVRRRLRLFSVLSSPRPGRFPGYVRILNDQTDQAVFYGQIEPSPWFPDAGVLLPLDLPVHARFPQSGRYTVQLWFFQETSADVLKMEQPFYVLEREA